MTTAAKTFTTTSPPLVAFSSPALSRYYMTPPSSDGVWDGGSLSSIHAQYIDARRWSSSPQSRTTPSLRASTDHTQHIAVGAAAAAAAAAAALPIEAYNDTIVHLSGHAPDREKTVSISSPSLVCLHVAFSARHQQKPMSLSLLVFLLRCPEKKIEKERVVQSDYRYWSQPHRDLLAESRASDTYVCTGSPPHNTFARWGRGWGGGGRTAMDGPRLV